MRSIMKINEIINNAFINNISEEKSNDVVLNEILSLGVATKIGGIIPALIQGMIEEAKEEKEETAKMLATLKKKIKKESITPEEEKQMTDQWKDLFAYGLVAAGSVGTAAVAGPAAGAATFTAGSYKKAIMEWIRNKSIVFVVLLFQKFGVDLIKELYKAITNTPGERDQIDQYVNKKYKEHMPEMYEDEIFKIKLENK